MNGNKILERSLQAGALAHVGRREIGRSPRSARAYSDQNERDYAVLVDAVKSARIKAQMGL